MKNSFKYNWSPSLFYDTELDTLNVTLQSKLKMAVKSCESSEILLYFAMVLWILVKDKGILRRDKRWLITHNTGSN
jgi:hypothetical protein